MFFARLLSQKPGRASCSLNELRKEVLTEMVHCALSGWELMAARRPEHCEGQPDSQERALAGSLEARASLYSATNLQHDFGKSSPFSEPQFPHL